MPGLGRWKGGIVPEEESEMTLRVLFWMTKWKEGNWQALRTEKERQVQREDEELSFRLEFEGSTQERSGLMIQNRGHEHINKFEAGVEKNIVEGRVLAKNGM